MRPVEQHLLDLPDVLRCEPPLVRAHDTEIDDGVRFDTTSEVDIGLDVAEREGARRGEQRPSSVKARIARACDGSPARRGSIDEDDVIEQVDRFETEHERWITMLLEHHRRRQGRFEAMSRSAPDDSTKAAQRVAAGFRVVGQFVQPGLNRVRRPQARNQPTLLRRERQQRRLDRVNAQERARL